MRKWIVGIILFIILLLILPFDMGMLAKHRLKLRFDELNQASNMPVKLAIKEYHTGWLKSTAIIELAPANAQVAKMLAASSASKKLSPISFKAEILHGPIIFDKQNGTRIHFGVGLMRDYMVLDISAKQQRALEKAIGKAPLIRESVLLHYFGSSTTRFFTAKVNYADPEYTVHWDGATGKLVISSSANKMKYSLDSAAVNMKAQASIFELSPLKFSGAMKRGIENFWFGDSHIHIPHIKFTQSNNYSLEINDINIRGARSARKNKLDTSSKWQIGKVIFNGDHYGPMEFNIAFSNLDAKAVRVLLDNINELGDPTHLSKQERNIAVIALAPKIFRALNGVKFNVDTKSTVPEGTVTLNSTVSAPELAADKVNPLSLMQGTSASIHFKAPQSILQNFAKMTSYDRLTERKQNLLKAGATDNEIVTMSDDDLRARADNEATQRIQNAIEKNYLIIDGNYYRFDASYKNLIFTINGKVINLQNLLNNVK